MAWSDLARRNDPEYLLSTSSRNRHSLSIIYTLFLKKRDSSFVTFRFVFVRLSSPQGRWRVHRFVSPIPWSFSRRFARSTRTRTILDRSRDRPGRSNRPSTLLQQRQPNQSRNFCHFVYHCYSIYLSSKHAHGQSLREHLQRPALDVRPHEGIPRNVLSLIGLIETSSVEKGGGVRATCELFNNSTPLTASSSVTISPTWCVTQTFRFTTNILIPKCILLKFYLSASYNYVQHAI